MRLPTPNSRSLTNSRNIGLATDGMVAVLSDNFSLRLETNFEECSVRLTDNFLTASLLRKQNRHGNEIRDSDLITIPISDIIGCQIARSRPVNRFYRSNQ